MGRSTPLAAEREQPGGARLCAEGVEGRPGVPSLKGEASPVRGGGGSAVIGLGVSLCVGEIQVVPRKMRPFRPELWFRALFSYFQKE